MHGSKLDLSKVFDKVEWDFLIDNLGFCEKWRNCIKQCISTSSLIFNLNGSPTEFINPECGIRQGDPLSLFAEVLSRLLSKGEQAGDIHSVKISRYDVVLSRLLFADDSFMLC